MRLLALLVLALGLALAATGAAAVRIGATECAVDLGGASGTFRCTLAITGALVSMDGSPVVTVDVPGGTTAGFRYAPAGELVAAVIGGEVASYSYDEAGRIAARVDADGQITRYTYDSDGRVASAGEWAFQYSDLGLVRASSTTGTVVDYTYDSNGRLLSVGQDGTAERFAYDMSGRIIHTEGSGGTIDYRYDDGQLVRRVDGLATTEFNYDQRGRLAQSSATTGEVTRFKYENSNALLRASDESGVTRFSYDRRGRLTTIVDPDGSETKFAYDAQSHLSLIHSAAHDEVTVAFVEGDPDRPLNTGAVFTRDRTPPWSLTLSGTLHTCGRCP